MWGLRTNQDLRAAGTKILTFVDITLMGRLSHQTMNLILQAGKSLKGWPTEAKS